MDSFPLGQSLANHGWYPVWPSLFCYDIQSKIEEKVVWKQQQHNGACGFQWFFFSLIYWFGHLGGSETSTVNTLTTLHHLTWMMCMLTKNQSIFTSSKHIRHNMSIHLGPCLCPPGECKSDIHSQLWFWSPPPPEKNIWLFSCSIPHCLHQLVFVSAIWCWAGCVQ